MVSVRSALILLLVALLPLGCSKPVSLDPEKGITRAGSTSPAPAGAGANGSGGLERALPGPSKPPSLDPIEAAIQSLIRDFVRDEDGGLPRAEVVSRLVRAFEKEELGDEEGRALEAARIADTMINTKTRFVTPGRPIDPVMQEQAIRGTARQFASEIYRNIPGPKKVPKHLESFGPPPPAGYQAVSWLTLGGFEYKERGPLPEAVSKLNEAKIAILGYMVALEEVEDIHEFLLVESLWSCCFGAVPEIHQVVLVKVPGARGLDLTTGPIQVIGTLSVGEEIEDGFVTSLYRIKTDRVQEVDWR